MTQGEAATGPVRSAAVVGAGIGGLMSALALQSRGIEVTVLERDADPPAGVTPVDSMAWLRKGVPQALHPHFFMGRLRLLLDARYPDLVRALVAAGAGEGDFEDYLHPVARQGYRPDPDDDRMRSINCRRTTFEMTVRNYVARLTGVRFVGDTRVRGLIARRRTQHATIAQLSARPTREQLACVR